jgi:hypothetical protein
MLRYNSSLNQLEWWDAVGSQWLSVSKAADYAVEYLVVAGGGGGGGRTGNNTGGNGGSGGSGIVIIRYLGDQRATGGTITSSGGYTIHTFTSSGTFTA